MGKLSFGIQKRSMSSGRHVSPILRLLIEANERRALAKHYLRFGHFVEDKNVREPAPNGEGFRATTPTSV